MVPLYPIFEFRQQNFQLRNIFLEGTEHVYLDIHLV